VTSYQDALVSFAFYEESIRSYFIRLCFKNLFLRLSLCLCVVARSIVNIQHSIGCLVVFSWYDVIVNKSSVRTFRRFFYNFLFFDVPQYSNIFHYIEDIQRAIYFNSQKSLHIIFKFVYFTFLGDRL